MICIFFTSCCIPLARVFGPSLSRMPSTTFTFGHIISRPRVPQIFPRDCHTGVSVFRSNPSLINDTRPTRQSRKNVHVAWDLPSRVSKILRRQIRSLPFLSVGTICPAGLWGAQKIIGLLIASGLGYSRGQVRWIYNFHPGQVLQNVWRSVFFVIFHRIFRFQKVDIF